MTRESAIARLDQCRAQARRLLKQLRSHPAADSSSAAERFRQLRSFSSRSTEDLARDRERVLLKNALAVIAHEHGYPSWNALKADLEGVALAARGEGETSFREDESISWYPRGGDVFLNRWFSRYEEARQSLDEEGGFLLPYRHHFFVCRPEAIRAMGLDPEDPDWRRIGWDAARRSDRSAYQRLREKREQAAREER
jgi:hypothetical protein